MSLRFVWFCGLVFTNELPTCFSPIYPPSHLIAVAPPLFSPSYLILPYWLIVPFVRFFDIQRLRTSLCHSSSKSERQDRVATLCVRFLFLLHFLLSCFCLFFVLDFGIDAKVGHFRIVVTVDFGSPFNLFASPFLPKDSARVSSCLCPEDQLMPLSTTSHFPPWQPR